jgi:hypothetical protein
LGGLILNLKIDRAVAMRVKGLVRGVLSTKPEPKILPIRCNVQVILHKVSIIFENDIIRLALIVAIRKRRFPTPSRVLESLPFWRELREAPPDFGPQKDVLAPAEDASTSWREVLTEERECEDR